MHGLAHSLNICWSNVFCDESTTFLIDSVMCLSPHFLNFLCVSCIRLQSQVFVCFSIWLSLLEAQRIIWLSDGILVIMMKFANMDIWDQLEGPIYDIANVHKENLIKTRFSDLMHLTWLHSYS
jgi:hypothetical protein